MVSRSISEEFTIDGFGRSVHPILIELDKNVGSIIFSQAYQTYHKEFIVGVKFELSFGNRLVKILVQKVSILHHHLTRVHGHHIGYFPTICVRLDAYFHCFTSEPCCCEYVVVKTFLADLFGAFWNGTTGRSKR
ncbi:hypothetical protein ACFX15_043512 [Malus domestica]